MAALAAGVPSAQAATLVTFGVAIGYSTSPVCNDTVVNSNSITVAPNTVLYECVRLQNFYDTTSGPASNVTVTDDQGVAFPGAQTIAKNATAYFISSAFTATATATHTIRAAGTGANGTVYDAGPDRGFVNVVTPALSIQKTVSTNGVCPGEVAAAPTCVTLQRGVSGNVYDALINSGQPSTNFGASGSLTAGLAGTTTRQALVKFDLSTIPSGAAVSSATLKIDPVVYSGAIKGARIHNVLAPWSETSVTWNSFNGAYAPQVLGQISAVAANTYTTVDLTSQVQGWVNGAVANNGVLLERDLDGFTTYASSESATAPSLQVCYVPPSCGGPWGAGVSGAELVTVLSGTPAKYCYQVTNSGTTALYGITETDNGASITVGDLGAGQSRTVSSCFTAVADADTYAVAKGVDGTGAPVSSSPDDAKVDVVAPALTVATTVSKDGTCPGAEIVNVLTSTPVTWCYTVTNNGDTAVSGIGVTDDIFGALGAPAFSLAPGASATVSRADVSTIDTTLTARASGTAAATGSAVQSNQDPAAINVVGPRIEVNITVSLDGTCPGQDAITVPAGTTASYCYEVGNIGDDLLDDVVVVDSHGAHIADIPTLDIGQTQTFHGGNFVVTADTQENIYGSAVDLYGYPVSAEDLAKIHALQPGLVVQKTVSTDGTCPGSELVQVLSGTNVTTCYAVTNNGATTLNGVVVADNGATISVGNLAPGQSASVSGSVVATADSNTAAVATGTVAGTGSSFSSAPDGAAIDVVSLSLAISKTVSADGNCPGSELVTVLPGTMVTTCYAVTNNSDVAVSNVAISDNGATIYVGDLAPGASTAAASDVAVFADSNTPATAAGSALGTTVTSPEDAAAVDVIHPALTVAKTVSTSGGCPGVESVTVIAGTPVTYCYVVTNSGDTAISGVTVSDNGATIAVGDLAPGQSGAAAAGFQATAPADTFAVADGTTVATGTPVESNQDDAAVLIVNPSLSIQKTVSTDGTCPGSELVQVLAGASVTYCYAVTNTGDTLIGGVTVSDAGVSILVGDLAPGQTGSGSAAVTATSDTNTPATASGTTAVTGTPVSSGPDGAAVDVVAPALTIQKTVSASGTCPGSEQVTTLVGSAVTYCYAVTNNGDTPVSGVVVSDNGVTVVIGDLGAGQSGSGAAEITVSGNTSTAATATGGVPATGTSVTSPPDGASVVVVNPSLAIEKTVSASGSCPGSELVTVLGNTGVTYCYKVTNNGDTTITGVTVADTGVGPVAIGDLAPGQSGSGTASYLALGDTNTPAVAAGTTAVTGTPIASPPDGAAIDVVTPALSIATTVSKTGSCPGVEVVNVLPNTPLTWCYVVTNVGDTAVSGVTVTDAAYGGAIPGAAFALAPGQSQTVSVGVNATADVTLDAYAAGTVPATGSTVHSPQDPAVVNVVAPQVDVDVTVSVTGACPGLDSVSVPAGTAVTYCYKVTNNGDDVLSDIDVTDGSGSLIGSLADLAPGASTTIKGDLTLVQGDVTVPATATGTDAYGFPVTDSDTALVKALFAKLSIQKTASLDGTCPGVENVTVLKGGAATYCYLVTNTGDTAVTNVDVEDGSITVPVGNLTPGQSVVVSTSITATSDLDTFATADGVNPATGKPVASAPDDAIVHVVSPSIALAKTVSLDGTCPGAPSVTVLPNTPATWCYVVTNNGDTTVGDIRVVDAGNTINVGTLAAGASTTLSSSVAVASDDITTAAKASGTDTATWTPVSTPDSSASIDVIHPQLSIATTVSLNGACPGAEIANVLAGTPITWCYAITNTGDVAVSTLSVSDSLGLPAGATALLQPGQTATVSSPSVATVDQTNAASASGTETALHTSVTSNLDPAAVNVVQPGIDIDVTVSTSGACPGVDSITVPAGTGVIYCYKVTNVGDDTLDNVVVKDASGATLTTIAVLGSGASTSFASASSTPLSTATATGTATGTDVYGFPVSDTDTAKVTVTHANLHIVKTAPSQVNLASAGGCGGGSTASATFSYKLAVSNLGDTTAIKPIVTDTLPRGVTYASATTTSGTCTFAAGTLTCKLADMAPGASATITVNVTASAAGTVTNTAVVSSSSIDSDLSDNTSSATTSIIGQGATRTQGFYSTHPSMTQACLTSLGGTMDLGFLKLRDELYDNEIDGALHGPDKDSRKETGISMVMGILNGNVSHYTNNAKRPALEQAQMQAAQQLVAAICNARYLGTTPNFDLNGMVQAMKSGNSALILSYAAQADAFNQSGDAINLAVSSGPANTCFPWDDPTDPND
jgi:uncharacterized repeat protein (TIGR01451 family)